MRFELTKFPPIRYTMLENHLFDKLPKNGKRFDSNDVVKMREAMGEWDVKFPLKNATVTMQRLLEKIDNNGEPFRIAKDDKAPGHHRVEYWVEARAPVRKKRKANGR